MRLVRWERGQSSWQELSKCLLNEQIQLQPFGGDQYHLSKYECMVVPHLKQNVSCEGEEGSVGARKSSSVTITAILHPLLEQSRA